MRRIKNKPTFDIVQVDNRKSLSFWKFCTQIKAQPFHEVCAPLVLLLLLTNVLAQTPIEFEHFRIHFDSCFELCNVEAFLQV